MRASIVPPVKFSIGSEVEEEEANIKAMLSTRRTSSETEMGCCSSGQTATTSDPVGLLILIHKPKALTTLSTVINKVGLSRLMISRGVNYPGMLRNTSLPLGFFLEACRLCNKKLSPGKDVYMYRVSGLSPYSLVASNLFLLPRRSPCDSDASIQAAPWKKIGKVASFIMSSPLMEEPKSETLEEKAAPTSLPGSLDQSDTSNTDVVHGERRGNEGGEEEEVEGECGFCLFMKGGGCKDAFIAWENCVEEAEKNKENMVDKCFEITSKLKQCMDAHADYYHPILNAEKAMEEEAERQLKEEAAQQSQTEAVKEPEKEPPLEQK